MLRFLLAAGVIASQGLAQVVINEFAYDDAGTDNFEYVELFNAGAIPVDISGWRIVNRDSGSALYGGASTDPTHIVPAATIMMPGTYYVIGNTAVPNVNLIVAVNSLENDSESIELYDVGLVLQDSVCYEMGTFGAFGNTFPSFPLEGNGLNGDLATGDFTSSIGRIFDGYDTNRNSLDFNCSMLPTPGTSNNEASLVPFADNFDVGPVGSTVGNWNRGFVFPRYVDPTVADGQNLQVKPPSPQGGLALSTWDNTGGGNSVQLNSTALSDVVVECYAWIEPVMTPVNLFVGPPYNATTVLIQSNTYNFADGESWTLGVRGTVSANANPANASGTYYSDIALGVGLRPHQVTGIGWVHYRTRNVSELYLVDYRDGAIPQTSPNPSLPNLNIIGGPISIVAGVNDGWQRLRLHVQGGEVIGNFGGTYGLDDGVRFAGTTTTTDPGHVYIGYREAILYNINGTAGCHPPVFDALDIHPPTTSKSFCGVGSPLSNAVIPSINSNGLAILGSTGFAITGSNLVPSFPFNWMGIGFSNFCPGGFPIPGAPPGANAYFFPVDLEFFPVGSDGAGNLSQLIPVPASLIFLGINFTTQIAGLDPGLIAFPLPIAMTQAMQMTVGN